MDWPGGHNFSVDGFCRRCQEPRRPMSQERRDACFCLASGTKFHPFDPCLADITIEDIAHGGAGINRFTGHHWGGHYSVDEHSYWVSMMVPHKYAKWGLLHDASESIGLNDLSSPVKKCMPEYKETESFLMGCICQVFDLPLAEPPEVKEADFRMYVTEVMQLQGPVGWLMDRIERTGVKPYDIKLECLPQAKAKDLFLKRFKELT